MATDHFADMDEPRVTDHFADMDEPRVTDHFADMDASPPGGISRAIGSWLRETRSLATQPKPVPTLGDLNEAARIAGFKDTPPKWDRATAGQAMRMLNEAERAILAERRVNDAAAYGMTHAEARVTPDVALEASKRREMAPAELRQPSEDANTIDALVGFGKAARNVASWFGDVLFADQMAAQHDWQLARMRKAQQVFRRAAAEGFDEDFSLRALSGQPDVPANLADDPAVSKLSDLGTPNPWVIGGALINNISREYLKTLGALPAIAAHGGKWAWDLRPEWAGGLNLHNSADWEKYKSRAMDLPRSVVAVGGMVLDEFQRKNLAEYLFEHPLDISLFTGAAASVVRGLGRLSAAKWVSRAGLAEFLPTQRAALETAAKISKFGDPLEWVAQPMRAGLRGIDKWRGTSLETRAFKRPSETANDIRLLEEGTTTPIGNVAMEEALAKEGLLKEAADLVSEMSDETANEVHRMARGDMPGTDPYVLLGDDGLRRPDFIAGLDDLVGEADLARASQPSTVLDVAVEGTVNAEADVSRILGAAERMEKSLSGLPKAQKDAARKALNGRARLTIDELEELADVYEYRAALTQERAALGKLDTPSKRTDAVRITDDARKLKDVEAGIYDRAAKRRAAYGTNRAAMRSPGKDEATRRWQQRWGDPPQSTPDRIGWAADLAPARVGSRIYEMSDLPLGPKDLDTLERMSTRIAKAQHALEQPNIKANQKQRRAAELRRAEQAFDKWRKGLLEDMATKDSRYRRVAEQTATEQIPDAGAPSVRAMGQRLAAGDAITSIPVEHVRFMSGVVRPIVEAKRAVRRLGEEIAEARAIGMKPDPAVAKRLDEMQGLLDQRYSTTDPTTGATLHYTADDVLAQLNRNDFAYLRMVEDRFGHTGSMLDAEFVHSVRLPMGIDDAAIVQLGKAGREASAVRKFVSRLGAMAVEQDLMAARTFYKGLPEYMMDIYAHRLEMPVEQLKEALFRAGSPKYDGSHFMRGVLKWSMDTAEREARGMLSDPRQYLAIGLARIINDIQFAKFANRMKSAKVDIGGVISDMVQQYDPGAGWVRLPKRTSLGDLAGQYVPEAAYQYIRGMEQFASNSKIYAGYMKSLRAWKIGKTVLNPASHFRQIMGNSLMADMANLSMGFKSARRPFKDAHRAMWLREGPLYDDLTGTILLGHSFVQSELDKAGRLAMRKELRKLDDLPADATNFDVAMRLTDHAVRGVGNVLRGLKSPRENIAKLARAYQAEDEFFKIWRFGQVRELQREFARNGRRLTREMRQVLGDDAFRVLDVKDVKSLEARNAAAFEAHRWFFNFDDIPQSVQWLRKSTAPFITYSYFAIPRVTSWVAENPFRAFFYRQAFDTFNFLSEFGEGERTTQEVIDEMKRRERATRDLPPYAQVSSMLLRDDIRFDTGNGMSDDHYGFWHFGSVTPMSQLNNPAAPGQFGSPLLDFFVNSPIVDTAGMFVFNSVPGSMGRRDLIVDAKHDPMEAAEVYAKELAQVWLPEPIGRGVRKVVNAYTHTPDRRVGGVTPYVRTMGEAIADVALGLRYIPGPKDEAGDKYLGRLGYSAGQMERSYRNDIKWNVDTAREPEILQDAAEDVDRISYESELNDLLLRDKAYRKARAMALVRALED